MARLRTLEFSGSEVVWFCCVVLCFCCVGLVVVSGCGFSMACLGVGGGDTPVFCLCTVCLIDCLSDSVCLTESVHLSEALFDFLSLGQSVGLTVSLCILKHESF